MTDPGGLTTEFAYDQIGRLITTIYPDATTTKIAYDALGRQVSETDQAGITTHFGYDALGRLVSVSDALNQVTSYTYDEFGSRLTQTDANGHVIRFEYDRRGRQIARAFPDGAREMLGFDVGGRLVRRVDPLGQTTLWAYDEGDRPTSKSFSSGAVVSYTYNPNGRRTSVTDARGVTSYEYDVRDRVIQMTYPDGRRITYSYDPTGSRKSVTGHLTNGVALTTSYSWDALNRLDSVTDDDGRIYHFGYDAVGNLVRLVHPNAVETSYQYDALNRLVELQSTVATRGDVVQKLVYSMDAAGNRIRIDEHGGGSWVYKYDVLHRLTSEEAVDGAGSLTYRNTFVYDAVGNRVEESRTASTGTTTILTSTYDSRDRLLDVDGTTYGWDANGNLTARDNDAFIWERKDQLAEASLDDGTIVRHVYDDDGVRVRTEILNQGAGTTIAIDYLVDTFGNLSQVLAETESGSGELIEHYVRGTSTSLLAVIRPAMVRFFHTDGLKSVRALSDETGTVTDQYQFEAFGALLKHVGDDTNTYLFAGEALDPAVGFTYHRARWMDPTTGRFISTDPMWPAQDPRVVSHPQTYADLSPVNKVDPQGLFAVSVTASLATLSVGGISLGTPTTTLPRRTAPWIDLYLRSFAPFRTFGGGFHGDDRTFSTSLHVTARAWAFLKFDTRRMRVGNYSAHSDPSGWLFFRDVAEGLPWVGVRDTRLSAEKTLIQVDLRASNPLVPGSPDINLYLQVWLRLTRFGYCLEGMLQGDAFPNAEFFSRTPTRPQGDMIHTFETSSKEEGPMTMLPGENYRPMGSFSKCVFDLGIPDLGIGVPGVGG